MIEQLKQHAKSKTQWFNVIILTLGIIELNMHLLQEVLGANYGIAFIAVSCASAYLRSVTSEAISDK